ncbi:MAG: hypothetical protein KC731_12815 [Myxococcales bacterium]|nr:hypothetical protein [Myxococcales bacterium]
MTRRHRATLAGVALLAPLWVSPARAEPSAQDRALAESLFREAKKLATGGEVEEACPKFAESHRLDPQLGTLLHLAACHEQEGRTATAWAEFNEAHERAKAQGDDRATVAKQRATQLEAKLSYLVVKSETPPPGLEVVLDGRVLSSASLGSKLPVDPGEHELEARAPGKETWTKQVALGEEGDVVRLEVPPRADAPVDAPALASGPTREAPSQTQWILGWVVGGVGLAGLGVMAGFGALAASQAADADSHCEGRFCDPEGLAGHDRASTSATISTVGLVVGVVGVGVGVTLLLTAPDGEDAAQAYLAPSLGGARLWVRW